MLARDLRQRIADRAEKIIVGGDDGAVEIELDHRLRTADRRDLAGVLHVADLLRGDVARELDDLHRLAAGIQDRIVGRLDPDLAAPLADALDLAGFYLPRLRSAKKARYSTLLRVSPGMKIE